MTLLTTFALLVAAHFLCDYPLQGDFLSKAKEQGPLRVWHLFGHSAIHGAAVGIVTGSLALGIAETIVHMVIDELKAKKAMTFAADQALHILCKLGWLLVLLAWGI